MSYIIKDLSGNIIDGGQTRNQVEGALKAHGLIPFNGKCPRRAKHGKSVIIANPLPFLSFQITPE